MEISRKVNRERVVVLGWGRAILLQLAHPLVAAGVADHSGFAGGRLSRLRRLHATVGSMRDFVFGDAERAGRAAARINAIHDRVHGRLSDSTAAFPAGTAYSATDPALLAWVHATLLESMPLAYERFVGPLPPAEKDRYCAEAVVTGRLLRIPETLLPRSTAELEETIARARRAGQIEVTATARSLAGRLLYPPIADPTRPAAWLYRLVALGMLPADIRRAYGFPWSARRERFFGLVAAAIRAGLPLVPSILRRWPEPRMRRDGGGVR